MKLIFLSIVLILSLRQAEERIVLKTNSGDSITVDKGIIYFNKNVISQDLPAYGGIVYSGKYNRLIEQNQSILLFLEFEGSPNLNTLMVFKITSHKATELVECVYNDTSQGCGPAPFTDMDNDGK